jgi:DNA-directed RNA polymerase II subunit RPB11
VICLRLTFYTGRYDTYDNPHLPSRCLLNSRFEGTKITFRRQLLLDPTVLFAGYKVPHPLENNITLKIQTDERSNPADALKRACTLLIQQTAVVKKQWVEQAKNIEMGMGPEAGGVGLGAVRGGVGGGQGGYDPYGDGLGGQQAQAGDVYDF